MTQSDTLLTWLMAWYESNCDGDWEHGYGISIATIDNPGWNLKVNIRGTAMENVPFSEANHNFDSDDDWWFCRVVDDTFEGFSSPEHLTTLIRNFRDWVESRQPV